MNSRKALRTLALTLACFCIAQSTQAHFLWLTSEREEGQSKAILYFSESAHQQNYHLPESMVNSTVWQRLDGKKVHQLKLTSVDTETRVGLEANLEHKGNAAFATTCDYGIYGGALLSYYAKHIRAENVKDLGALGRDKKLKLEIIPRVLDGSVELSVLWQGKPKSRVEMTVTEPGDKVHTLKTDAQGRARYQPTTVGLVGIRAGFTDRETKGELNGKEYVGASHYATLTYQVPSLEAFPQKAKDQPAKSSVAPAIASDLPILPEGLASFGGAVHDGWLYVYSGHTGGAHDHSRDNLSQRFQRIKLAGGEAWEELPMQTPIQGLALVSHKSGLYRIGGLKALNADGEEEDLHSIAEFARYEPTTQKWTTLANLPAARSSHDAVVIGDKIYVAGGWTLDGDRDGVWTESAIVFDLSDTDGTWKSLPKSPFQRRAVATCHWQGKLLVLGGIDPERDISFDTHIYDPETQAWTSGPKLPGQGMDGFGISAWNLNGKLYVSGLEGIVQRLNADGQGWQEAVTMKTPRFFHQLLPYDETSLLAVAGASSDGHLNQTEKLSVAPQAATR